MINIYLNLLQINLLNLQLYKEKKNFEYDIMNIIVEAYDVLKGNILGEKIKIKLLQLKEYYLFD